MMIYSYFENKYFEIDNNKGLWGYVVGSIVTSDDYGILYQKKAIVEGMSMDNKKNMVGELFPRQILWVTIINENKTIGFIQPRALRNIKEN